MENPIVVAVYGWGVEHENFDAVVSFFEMLRVRGWEVQVYEDMARWLYLHFAYRPEGVEIFRTAGELRSDLRFMISLGGDGTFLDTAQYALGRDLPVLGLNFGHLGFLTSSSGLGLGGMLDALAQGNYVVEERVTACVTVSSFGQEERLYALNDVALQKAGKSMLIINAHVDGIFLCTYWCDGLIVSTPTGSTAYSLSVGGPIIVPTARALLVSPMAPHNLGIRPLILPDSSTIHLRATSRDPRMLLSVDAQVYQLEGTLDFTVTRGDRCVRVVRMKDEHFFTSLREKLNWGMDARN